MDGEAIADALACIRQMPADATPRRQMAWLVQRFTDDPDLAARFEDAFRASQRIYETLAPDARLSPYLDNYRRLVRLHAVWKHGSREDTFDIHVTRVDLTNDEIQVIATRESEKGIRVSDFAKREHALVAINGDYFDINQTY